MPTTYPTTADELTAELTDTDKAKVHFADPAAATAFVQGTVAAMIAGDPGVQEQIAIEAQKGAAEIAKAGGFTESRPPMGVDYDPVAEAEKALRSSAGMSNYARVYNRGAPGVELGVKLDYKVGSEASTSEFFQSIWHKAASQGTWLDLQSKFEHIQAVTAAYSSQIGPDGGFLLPEQMRAELLSISLEQSIVRPRARVIPMSGAKVVLPAIDSTSNVSSVFGGVVMYWTEDGASLTESNVEFQTIDIEPKTLTGYTEINNTTLADTMAFGAFFDQTFPEAMAFSEDDAFLVGNGVGKPLGALNSGSAISVTKETGQAAATILWENIVKMYSRMLPQSLARAVWVVSPDTFPELATMALSVGTGGSAIWLNNGTTGPPMTILGRPVLVSEKVSVLGTAGDINFIDFGFYIIGDRQLMTAASSEHFKFQNNRTVFRLIERVDGRMWLDSAMTPKNNGPALSPVVKLATRA